MIARIRTLFPPGSIKGDALRILVLQTATLGIGTAAGIAIARTLGPGLKGQIDIFNLLTSFLVDFGTLGIGSGLLFQLANRGRPLAEVHGTGLAFSLGAGLAAAAAGVFGIPLWQQFFPNVPGWILLTAFLLAPFRYYNLVWSSLMTGLNRIVQSHWLALGFAVASTAGVFVLLAAGRLDVPALVALAAATTVVGVAVSYAVVHRTEPALAPSGKLLGASLRFSSLLFVANIANVLHFKADQVMVNYWLGSASVGLYAVAVRWAETLFLLDGALSTASLYRVCTAPPGESYALARRVFRTQLAISGGCGLLLALLARPLILLLYGQEFAGAALPLAALVPGVVAWSAGKVVAGMLSYNLNRTGFVTTVAVAGAVLNIALNYFSLAAGFGIVGVAVASSVSYTAVLLAILAGSRALAGRRPDPSAA